VPSRALASMLGKLEFAAVVAPHIWVVMMALHEAL
jgi:hypothetical protein